MSIAACTALGQGYLRVDFLNSLSLSASRVDIRHKPLLTSGDANRSSGAFVASKVSN